MLIHQPTLLRFGAVPSASQFQYKRAYNPAENHGLSFQQFMSLNFTDPQTIALTPQQRADWYYYQGIAELGLDVGPTGLEDFHPDYAGFDMAEDSFEKALGQARKAFDQAPDATTKSQAHDRLAAYGNALGVATSGGTDLSEAIDYLKALPSGFNEQGDAARDANHFVRYADSRGLSSVDGKLNQLARAQKAFYRAAGAYYGTPEKADPAIFLNAANNAIEMGRYTTQVANLNLEAARRIIAARGMSDLDSQLDVATKKVAIAQKAEAGLAQTPRFQYVV